MAGNQKEYGKFTAEQIHEFIEFIPQVQQARSEYITYLRNNPDNLNKRMSEPLKWSWTYELSIYEHIAMLTVESGSAERLVAMSMADDSQQAILDDIKTEIHTSLKPTTSPQSLLTLIEPLVCSIECVVIYGRYRHRCDTLN